jgi:hypothetical protein
MNQIQLLVFAVAFKIRQLQQLEEDPTNQHGSINSFQRVSWWVAYSMPFLERWHFFTHE